MIFIDHHIQQIGTNLTCTDNIGKIIINKYENKISRIVFNFDDDLLDMSGRFYFVMLNPETEKYTFLPIVDNAVTITTQISIYPGIWKSLLVVVNDDYEIIDGDIDQSKTTYVSDEFKRIIVKDNFLDEDESSIEKTNSLEIDALIDEMIKTLNEAKNIVSILDADLLQRINDILNMIILDGDGTKFLSDDGNYYKINSEISSDADINENELNQMLEEVLAK